jgi:hypothetical protein
VGRMVGWGLACEKFGWGCGFVRLGWEAATWFGFAGRVGITDVSGCMYIMARL